MKNRKTKPYIKSEEQENKSLWENPDAKKGKKKEEKNGAMFKWIT